ncbi:hypothetical protein PVK06_010560 [Gossypium arboreum]|uniref:Uncharacterized protein n=1 Tax=Gossypium arboreum TaxID=29729 RepID=A0ABR0Q6K9_GOSAR|nr:hypothetical protein PVK06_010560 [Gossypium arboreum]
MASMLIDMGTRQKSVMMSNVINDNMAAKLYVPGGNNVKFSVEGSAQGKPGPAGSVGVLRDAKGHVKDYGGGRWERSAKPETIVFLIPTLLFGVAQAAPTGNIGGAFRVQDTWSKLYARFNHTTACVLNTNINN